VIFLSRPWHLPPSLNASAQPRELLLLTVKPNAVSGSNPRIAGIAPRTLQGVPQPRELLLLTVKPNAVSGLNPRLTLKISLKPSRLPL